MASSLKMTNHLEIRTNPHFQDSQLLGPIFEKIFFFFGSRNEMIKF